MPLLYKITNQLNIMKKLSMGISFSGICLLLLLMAGLVQPLAETQPASALRPALTVTVIQPEQQEIPVILSANGSIAAWQEAVIGSEVNGLQLAEIKAQVGDQVKKNEVLAVFNDEKVTAEIAQSQAVLAEAEANLQDARLNAERAEGVAGSGAISEQQITQYRTSAKTAEAKVQSAKAALAQQLLKLRHTRVIANDDGVISARSATLGSVPAEGAELFRLIRQNRLEWRGEITASEFFKLKTGMSVDVEVSGAGKVKGKIRALAATMDTQNRNGLIYVDIPDAYRQGLRAGMFARGVISLGSHPALTIPLDALSLREGFSYVFRLEQQTAEGQFKVSQVKVQPGRNLGDRMEVVSGLSSTDRLVASGTAFLSDGDSVKVVAK